MNQVHTYIYGFRKLPWRQITGLLCIFLVLGCFWLDREQNQLADKMLRLHVLANSNTEEDQALKLRVRDKLLTKVEPWLAEQKDIDGVKTALRSHTGELESMAEAEIAQEGYPYSVHVELEKTWFPTRQYNGFSLPAGKYDALRVVIGEGAGKNWWCVVFPPLCLATSSEKVTQEAAQAGLEDQEVFLILEDNQEYVIKFRAIELWENLKHQLDKA